MTNFDSTLAAYRVARERASVAASFEADLLHTAIYDAREAGVSVREAAGVMQVPKSTVARHWREGHRCSAVPPLWGSEEAWREARAAIWAHEPDVAADDVVPYAWVDDGGRRTVLARPSD